jgi:hypothetical protein
MKLSVKFIGGLADGRDVVVYHADPPPALLLPEFSGLVVDADLPGSEALTAFRTARYELSAIVFRQEIGGATKIMYAEYTYRSST